MLHFTGYNNGKAIAVNNHKNLMKAFRLSAIPAVLLSVIAILTEPWILLVVWIFPGMMLLFSRMVFWFEKYDEEVFLQGQKKKHDFLLLEGKFYKDGKEMKDIQKVEIYEYKGYLLLEFNRDKLGRDRFYLVPDDAYIAGSREELLKLRK